MSEPIGEARVIVRPVTTGFASEAAAGLKQPLLSLGKLVTGALAIKGGFDLGKEIVGDAARVQKSTETIRAEFGKAGQSIIDFADTAGLKLGIASHESEDTAARFGILFKNIGVGKGQAAEMTVNLEKLAGSIAAIRGKDPGQILGTLPLALSGSLRGLRQLGFAFSQQQLKDEALRLGLISTTKQALDPGARAIAIYALATQHLGDYQRQAAAHANDSFNIQKRLTAEWDHAKESVGLGLLPVISKYGGELADFIDKGTKSGKIQHQINTVASDGKQVIEDVAGAVKDVKDAYGIFADLVGGDHNAIKILADAFLLLYTRSKLIKWGVIAGGEKEVGGAAVVSAGEVTGLAGALRKLEKIGPITVAILLDLIPHAKTSKDPNAFSNSRFAKDFARLPVVGGLFSQANHLADEINKKLGIEGDKTAASVTGAKKKIADAIQSPFLTNTFAEAKIANPTITRRQYDLARQIAESIKAAGTSGAVKSASTEAGAAVGKSVGDGVKAAGPKISAAALQSVRDAVTAAKQQLSVDTESLQLARQQETLDVADSKKQVADAIQQAKQNLSSLASSLASDAGAFLDKQAAAPGGTGGILGKQFRALRDQILKGGGGPDTARAAKEAAAQLQARSTTTDVTGLKDKITRRFADLSDLFDKGAIGASAFNRRSDQILKSVGVNAHVIQRTEGVAAADQFRADFSGLKAQVRALAAGPQAKGKTGLEATIVRPLDTLREQQRRLAADDRQIQQAQLTVERDQHAVERAALAEQKKQATLLAKIEAKLPSKHDSEALAALLRKQAARNDKPKPKGTAGKTAADLTRVGGGAP